MGSALHGIIPNPHAARVTAWILWPAIRLTSTFFETVIVGVIAASIQQATEMTILIQSCLTVRSVFYTNRESWSRQYRNVIINQMVCLISILVWINCLHVQLESKSNKILTSIMLMHWNSTLVLNSVDMLQCHKQVCSVLPPAGNRTATVV